MKLKVGVSLKGLQPQTVVGMMVARDLLEKEEVEFVITSCNDSTHGEGSLHYKGLAFDVRTKGIEPKAYFPANRKSHLESLRAQLAQDLGEEWDVVLEFPNQAQEHLHVEHDPK